MPTVKNLIINKPATVIPRTPSLMDHLTHPNKEYSPHSVDHTASLRVLWIIVDGVGLALVAACTLFDAFHEW